MFGVSAATIMRHEMQLRTVAAEIREANAIIEETKAGCKTAAEALAANWAGDAREAFVAEQMKATTWLEKMIELIKEMVSTIEKVNSTYTQAEQTVTQLINKK